MFNNRMKIGTIGIDIRVLKSSAFLNAVRAAEAHIGQKVLINAVNGQKMTYDALLLNKSLADKTPVGIPVEIVDIDEQPANEITKRICTAICNLHDLFALSHFD